MAKATISVYFKLSSGKAFSAEHFPSATVKAVADGVAKAEGLPEGRVRLKYQGKALDVKKTIGYLGVCEETILRVEIIAVQDMTLKINIPGSHQETVIVQNVDTVRRLKEMIADLPDVPPISRQRLKVRGGPSLLTDNSTFLELGLTGEIIIDVADTGLTSTTTDTEGDDPSTQATDEETKMGLLNTFDSHGKRVDVVFCFDTTGSMYSCLQTVRQKLGESCRRLLRDIPNMRIGIMAHGDYCDNNRYVLRYIDLTADVESLVSFADGVPSTGGGDAPEVRRNLSDTISRLLRDIPRMRIGIMANGDYCDYKKYVVEYVDLTSNIEDLVTFARNVPSTGGGGNGGECYEWALRKAQELDWSEDSAKALVMIGDELPHPPAYTDQHVFWMDELDILKGMGVKVYGVQALDRNEATPFYQEISERTDGYYLKLKNFSLITDMFLAVCYRESNQQQLEAFRDEVESEGRMTEDTKQFLTTLETENKPNDTTEASNPAQPGQPRRYVNAPWWDPTLQVGTCHQYVYENGNWGPVGGSRSSSSRSGTSTSVTSSPSRSFGSASDAPIHQPIILNLPPKRKSLVERVYNRIFKSK